METNSITEKLKLYVLELVNEQFMYSDEIIENCLAKYGSHISTSNLKLTIKNQIKILADDKLVAYYHGYKITPKGKMFLSKS